jgi:hypothetical protein
MKFHPCPRYGSFVDTPRKRAAARRRQQRERDSLPLFAGMIALAQPSIDRLMLARAQDWDAQEQRDRDRKAQNWRSVRADIFALPPHQRRLIHTRAQHYSGPLNPTAYAYFYALATGFHRPGAPCGMGGKPYPRAPPPSPPHPPSFNHPAPGIVPGVSFNKEQNPG